VGQLWQVSPRASIWFLKSFRTYDQGMIDQFVRCHLQVHTTIYQCLLEDSRSLSFERIYYYRRRGNLQAGSARRCYLHHYFQVCSGRLDRLDLLGLYSLLVLLVPYSLLGLVCYSRQCPHVQRTKKVALLGEALDFLETPKSLGVSKEVLLGARLLARPPLLLPRVMALAVVTHSLLMEWLVASEVLRVLLSHWYSMPWAGSESIRRSWQLGRVLLHGRPYPAVVANAVHAARLTRCCNAFHTS
jgi:hypothetical protein